MKWDKFIELAYLFLLDELSFDERIELENVMMQDDELKSEFENIKESFEILKESKPQVASERILVNARQTLMRQVRAESVRVSFFRKLAIDVRKYVYENYTLAISGLVTFVLGIIVCYILLIPKSNKQILQPEDRARLEQATKDDVKISNLQISQPDSKNGEVEVKFDAVKPIQYKAKVDDPAIQKLLLASLFNEDNPGARIKSVSTIAQQFKGKEFKYDLQIKNALIKALKTDSNPAVRKEALVVLNKYPYDEEIRDVLLYVLSNDRNSGMRVAAINALTDLQQNGHTLDEAVKNVLTKKAEADKNDYVKIRAASILQEEN
jgi:hypothetical protein